MSEPDREPEIIQLPDRTPEYEVPQVLLIAAQQGMRFSPNDIRTLKAETGKRLAELTGEDADEADQMQTMAWLRLRREGSRIPWSECGDIALEFEVDDVDPMSGEPSKTSPPSVDSGA